MVEIRTVLMEDGEPKLLSPIVEHLQVLRQHLKEVPSNVTKNIPGLFIGGRMESYLVILTRILRIHGTSVGTQSKPMHAGPSTPPSL